MYQKKLPAADLDCGLNLFKEVIHGKWKIILLYHINNGIKRPGQLQKMMPDADRRVLDIQLGELTIHGLISKIKYPSLPPKVEYEMTALGKTILPVIVHMSQWGDAHRVELQKHINYTSSIKSEVKTPSCEMVV